MKKQLPLVLVLAGIVLLYVGERVLTETPRFLADGLSVIALIAGTALAYMRVRAAQGEARKAYGSITLHYALVQVALLLYLLQLPELSLVPAGKPQVALLVIWPALLALGLLPAIAMEASIAGSVIELPRIRAAARAARIVTLAVIAFAGINYAASVWNHKVDLSYFKTSQPSASTLEIVKTLTSPVEILLFYPAGNDVLEQVQPYAEALAKASDQVSVRVVDQALDVELAKDLKVRNNGFIFVRANGHDEQLKTDVELDDARNTLKNLDAEMQTRLIKAVRPPRVAYLTTGHGERDTSQATPDGRTALADLKQLLDMQGFNQKRYGLAEGSSGEVPSDATVVIVVDPTAPFLQAEIDGLTAYMNKGGRLVLFTEADNAAAAQPIASLVGIEIGNAPIAADSNRVRMKDRGDTPYYWATGTVPTHASETTLGKAGGRAPLVIINGGRVSKKADASKDLTITATLKSGADAYEDLNRNSAADATEKRGAIEIAQAVEGKVSHAATDSQPARAIVVGDADMVANGVLAEVQGNAIFFVDALRWLAGDDTISGPPVTEKDVPILHRKEKDAVWFFGTSFLVPALVLGAGLGMSKRARRSRNVTESSNG